MFDLTSQKLEKVNELIKTFDIEILQTNKDSNLKLPFIDIEDL